MFNTSKSQSSKQAGGAKRDRTADLLRARQALSQLSYSPSMLVFFAFCGVATPHSLGHVHEYVPALVRRAPCIRQKILRLEYYLEVVEAESEQMGAIYSCSRHRIAPRTTRTQVIR